MRNKHSGKLKQIYLLATIAASITGTAASCSGRTTAYLTIDILSFFKSDERVVEFWLPPFGRYDFYFLPGLQLDDADAGPDKAQAGGMLFDLPTVPDSAFLTGMTVAFRGDIAVRNLNPSGILQLVHLSVFIASVNASNIYEEGAMVASVPVDPIGPGESAEAIFSIEISEGSPLAEIINTSSMRLGMKLTYPETTGAMMKAGFELTHIELSAFSRLFLLLPG